VTLLQTTDIHDHGKGSGPVSEAPSALGGYARIAAYVEQVRASCGHPVLLVDSGDWSMGTIYDLTLARRPLALWFADALRYDCLTLGNHEFDDTPAGLAGTLRAARQGFGLRTPIVASNLELNGDNELAPFLGPGRLIRKSLVETLPNGLRVGFLGLMGRDAASVAPAAAPVRFTDYGRNYGPVQALVDRLRDGQGCRLVIALDHAGTDATGAEGEDVDLARHVTGIDVIASGHMHNPLASARTVANGAWTTLICCAGAFGDHVSRLDLLVPPSGAPILEASANPAMTDAVLAALEPPARPDPAFAFIVAGADLELNRALAPVFTQVARFPDYASGNPARGLYHPVAGSAQDLQANGSAAAAERDAASGSTRLDALLMAQAMAAIGPVSAFAPGDPACTGPALALGSGRRRVVLDLYMLLMIDAVQSRFGISVAVYQTAQGGGKLTGTPDGLKAALANRLNLDPGGPFQEVKTWTALLLYLTTPPAQGGHFAGGWITPEYGSCADFTRFPAFGAAVRTRNASYPLDSISALAAMVETLRAAP
jgi:hypothetical protein